MKLYWSSRSPFVRKVMVFAHEVGVADRLEPIRTVVSTTNRDETLDRITPLGQIPTLVTDDGELFYDSLVICCYLDTLHDGRRLVPEEERDRLRALRRHAHGNGMLDTLLKLLIEERRPEANRSAVFLDAHRAKTGRALGVLEAMVDELEALPVDIGHVAIATALAYLDFRFADLRWRDGRPRLAGWYAAFAERPSMVMTGFEDTY